MVKPIARWFAAIASIASGVPGLGCNYDSPELGLFALAAEETCSDVSCAFALGMETDIYVSADGRLSGAVVFPPELATIAISDDNWNWLQVHPLLSGSGTLTIFVDGDVAIVRRIDTAPLATTKVVPAQVLLAAGPLYPDRTTQFYAGNTMRVLASHQDRDGRPLLGHGMEAWTISGGSFRTANSPLDLRFPQVDELELDSALLRDVIADGDSEITISAGPGSSALRLGVVGPRSAASLDLEDVGSDGVVWLRADEEARPLVLSYDARGGPIGGIPAGGGVEVHVADERILIAHTLPHWRRLYLRGKQAGTTDLTVRFDGIEAHFTVRVH